MVSVSCRISGVIHCHYLLLFSGSDVSYSLRPQGLQHSRLLYPSPTSTLCLFFLQSFPAPGSFPMSLLFTSGSQSTGVSASASVLPMNIQGWFPLGLTGLISLLSKGLARVFSSNTIWKHQFFGVQSSLWFNSHICTWLLKKNIASTVWTLIGKVMSLYFNILSGFLIAFMPRSNI